MKTLLLFVVSLVGISQINSQVLFNRAYHERVESPKPFLMDIHNDLYYVAEEGFSGQYSLYKQSSTGLLKFKTQILTNENPMVALKSHDKKLVFAGTNYKCDVFVSQHNFICKFDTNANAIFTSTYAVSIDDDPKACVQLSDSSYYSFTDSLLFKHSKSGQFISKTNLGLNSISSALVLPNDVVLISGKSGNSIVLITFSTNLVVSSTVSVPILFNKLLLYNSQQIMGLGTDGKLYKISPSLGLINSSAFSGGMLVNDFICSHDSVYSILSSLSSSSHYAATDTSFAIISQSSTSTHSISQVAICLNGSQIAILSSGIAGSNATPLRHHTFSSLSVMNKFSSNNFENDLELLSFSPDSTKVSCYYSSLPEPGEYHCSPYLRPKFKVKNNGTKTITHFKLNCFDAISVSCGTFYYQELFSGFALLPGDSITLTATNFARTGFGYHGVAPSFSTNFCFYVSLPNGETDKIPENNEICGTYNFLTTSIKKYDLQSFNLKVFPNPLENNLNLKSEVSIKNIEVMNALGATIANKVVNSTKSELDTSDWAAGVYFLKIETEQGMATRKVVKQ